MVSLLYFTNVSQRSRKQRNVHCIHSFCIPFSKYDSSSFSYYIMRILSIAFVMLLILPLNLVIKFIEGIFVYLYRVWNIRCPCKCYFFGHAELRSKAAFCLRPLNLLALTVKYAIYTHTHTLSVAHTHWYSVWFRSVCDEGRANNKLSRAARVTVSKVSYVNKLNLFHQLLTAANATSFRSAFLRLLFHSSISAWIRVCILFIFYFHQCFCFVFWFTWRQFAKAFTSC